MDWWFWSFDGVQNKNKKINNKKTDYFQPNLLSSHEKHACTNNKTQDWTTEQQKIQKTKIKKIHTVLWCR